MTFFFYNASVSAKAQAQDAKNPLTDLDGDGTVGIGDMVVFMHYDNLAGGGGKTRKKHPKIFKDLDRFVRYWVHHNILITFTDEL